MHGADPLFPAFLKLTGREVTVVGGGRVAASKVQPLLRAGACIKVVAPEVIPALRRCEVSIIERAFEPGDLDGAWLVVAAASAEVNRHVCAAAELRRLFVMAASESEQGSACYGATVNRGGVDVAISTGGRAPALAGLLREAIESILPMELDGWLRAAEAARASWQSRGVPISERRSMLLDELNRLYGARTASVSGTLASSAPPPGGRSGGGESR